jgi:hypothetical protein
MMPDVSKSFAVRIVEPAEHAYTNGVLKVRAQVDEGPYAKVKLFADGAQVVEAEEPYELTWDTGLFAEGDHSVIVRAELRGTMVESPPLVVTVDRTPPQVVSVKPANGDTNLFYRDPIAVEFDEPMRTRPSNRISIFDAEPGPWPNLETQKLLELWERAQSADGKRVVISPSPLPRIPFNMGLSFDDVVDRAGNPTSSFQWTGQFPKFSSSIAVGYALSVNRISAIDYVFDQAGASHLMFMKVVNGKSAICLDDWRCAYLPDGSVSFRAGVIQGEPVVAVSQPREIRVYR